MNLVRSRWLIPAGAPLLAFAVGAAAARSLPLGLAVLLPVAAAAAGMLARDSARLFGRYLAFILAGYAFLDRGFAYLGVPPLYVGEVGLAIAVFATVIALPVARLGWVHALLIAFIGLGALRTAPYVAEDGIDAFRDGVLWGYAAFALAISLVATRGGLERAVAWYGRLVPWWLVAAPALFVAGIALAAPQWPGTDVSLLAIKGGDLGVQAAGVGAFLLAGLWRPRRGDGALREAAAWLPWLAAAALAASASRGAAVAIVLSIAAVLVLQSPARFFSARVARLGAVATAFAILFVAVNPSFSVGEQREVNPRQLVNNVFTVFFDSGGESAEADRQRGTREYRLEWWGEIASYTFNGPYFWTGKGFGVNLADDDGFQVTVDGSLRAPHNSHITILARMGVPGLALWVLLQGAFVVLVVRAVLRARAAGDTWLAAVGTWLFALWVAMMVNTSFDPYLEGPQGGIWFWAVMGLGFAVASMAPARHEEAAAAHPRRP